MSRYLFTSESVTEGHPDKVADCISDAILDAHLAQDSKSRVACETLVKTGVVVVAGEITSRALVNYGDVAREQIRRIGYTDPAMGFSDESVAVMAAIERSYLEPVDQHGLFEAAMDGVFSKLDEHSAFIDGEGQRDLEALLDQEFGGVGLELAVDPGTGRLTVVAPVVGSPAWRAGLAVGERIDAIDGVVTAGMPLRDAVGRLRGNPGTPVVVRVAPPEGQAADPSVRDVTLVREAVRVECVLGDRRRQDGSWDWRIEGHPSIALIRITSFGEHTGEDLRRAIEAIEKDGRPRGVVLDLRGNPGGLLAAAVEVCDILLDDGLIVSTRGRSGTSGDVATLEARRATPGAVLQGVPMAVLIDGLTASAGEIVAACLQDNARATIVGSRSFGKGTVQSIVPLADGDGLVKLTTSEYLRPSNANIHRRATDGDGDEWGVSPDKGHEIAPTGKRIEALRRWRVERDAVPARRDDGSAPSPPSAADLPGAVDPVLARSIEAVEPRPARSPAG